MRSLKLLPILVFFWAPAAGIAGAEDLLPTIPLEMVEGGQTLPRPIPPPPPESTFDILVYGGTPGGIAAAVAAARLGSQVALVEPGRHLGGMMAGGLGQSDVGNPRAIGGLAREFFARVYNYYRDTYGPNSPQVRECHRGYRFEPHVAEGILNRMVAEQPRIALFLRHRLRYVLREGLKVVAIRVRNLEDLSERTLRAPVFIDASYEGDLAALAGVVYRVGREPSWEFKEEFAGVVYWEGGTKKGPGSTGEGDHRVQAYNFRVCLTNRPDNRVPIPRPPDYNPDDYQLLREYIAAKGVKRLDQCIYFGRLPNDKYDINNQGYAWQSTDYIEGNFAYPGSNPEGREVIIQRHRNYVLGLLYFLQHDPSVPEQLRREAQQWGLPRDEFPDTGHFPFQLYVRECRRIVGEYMFSEHDARLVPGQQRTPLHRDSIACGSYSMDSHATTKWQRGQTTPYPEGFFYLGRITKPYQIPYRILLPRKIEGLLVAVGVSATHLGYGTLRMEPVYMEMGQACGTAAHLAVQLNVLPRQVPIDRLQRLLAGAGQVLTVFNDVPFDHPYFAALTYCGTRGFFPSYDARPDEPLTQSTAAEWLKLFFGANAPRVVPGEGPLTRAQMAVWLVGAMEKAAGWERNITSEPRAADVGPKHPAFAAVQTLYQHGVPQAVWGEGAQNFQPQAPLTRAEFCALLYAAQSGD